MLLARGLLIVRRVLLHKAFFQTVCIQCMLISGITPPKMLNFALALVELDLLLISSAPLSRLLMRTLDTTGSRSSPISGVHH